MERKITADSGESKKRILKFLQSHPIGVLATVDPNNQPHAAVIYFNVTDDFDVTFISKHQTKKHDNIMHNKQVMLVAYEASSQTTAQIIGTAEEIADEAESQTAFKHMLLTAEKTSNEGLPPISKLYAGKYTAFRIIPATIRMAVFSRPTEGGYDMFETLEFAD